MIADVLGDRGVRFLYALCGGHISPILVAAKARGIRVVDVRDERDAVFAADATARLTGEVGVAAVTAGPGVTNTVTALKNAQLAQSPVVVLGGAAATVLQGRGALQDIDQLSLMRPLTKWVTSVRTHAALRPTLERAFALAADGVPGPVFVEVPIDLLYPEKLVRDWYLGERGKEQRRGLAERARRLYLEAHLFRQFRAPALPRPGRPLPRVGPVAQLPARLRALAQDERAQLELVAEHLRSARRPALVIGSQAMAGCGDPGPLAAALRALGLPTFLGGTARGLLGRRDPLQLRHHRSKALKDADLVIVAGFPFDFRLGYGRGITRKGTLVAANLSLAELRQNRHPDIALPMHPGHMLIELAQRVTATPADRPDWFELLRQREAARDGEIADQAALHEGGINPLHFLLRLEEKLSDDAVLVADGGDFVATAAYVLRPRAPLSWLDPGVFGTLGVGGGFAMGAALVKPGREVWLLYGDGSCAYSLSEFDTFARHGLAPIAVIGNDGSWAQIARDQVEILGDDVGTVLQRRAYHTVAEGYGGVGLLLEDPVRIDETLDHARDVSRQGRPVCINVHLGKSAFRKGSISM